MSSADCYVFNVHYPNSPMPLPENVIVPAGTPFEEVIAAARRQYSQGQVVVAINKFSIVTRAPATTPA